MKSVKSIVNRRTIRPLGLGPGQPYQERLFLALVGWLVVGAACHAEKPRCLPDEFHPSQALTNWSASFAFAQTQCRTHSSEAIIRIDLRVDADGLLDVRHADAIPPEAQPVADCIANAMRGQQLNEVSCAVSWLRVAVPAALASTLPARP